MSIDNFERLEVNRRSWLETGRQRINMLPQWLRGRNHDSPCGLSRPEADLVLTEIQVVPGQRRDISQPLSGIQSKQDQTPPFCVCGREYPQVMVCGRRRGLLRYLIPEFQSFVRVTEARSRSAADPKNEQLVCALPIRPQRCRRYFRLFVLGQFSVNSRTVAVGRLLL